MPSAVVLCAAPSSGRLTSTTEKSRQNVPPGLGHSLGRERSGDFCFPRAVLRGFINHVGECGI